MQTEVKLCYSAYRTRDHLIYSSSGQNFLKLLSLIILRNFSVAPLGKNVLNIFFEMCLRKKTR
jgi:hypothetical protein